MPPLFPGCRRSERRRGRVREATVLVKFAHVAESAMYAPAERFVDGEPGAVGLAVFLAFVALGPAVGVQVDRVEVCPLQDVGRSGFLADFFQQANCLAIMARRFRAFACQAKLCSQEVMTLGT